MWQILRRSGLCNASFEYFTLIQLYQFTYKGHEDAAGVPIVTEKTAEAEANNNPRAAVKDVYKQIMDDLNIAIDYLTDSRSAKSEINRQVAYGLRARVNLVMQNWSDAATDAKRQQKAILLFLKMQQLHLVSMM